MNPDNETTCTKKMRKITGKYCSFQTHPVSNILETHDIWYKKVKENFNLL